MLAVVSTEIEVVALVRPAVGLGIFVPDVLVLIVDAAPVIGIVIPVVQLYVVAIEVIDIHVLVDVDANFITVPIEGIVSVPDAVSDGEARAPGNAARQRPAGNPARCRRIIIGRISGIGPSPINNGRLVIRHIDDLGRGRLDNDHLLVGLLFDRNRLLLGRL